MISNLVLGALLATVLWTIFVVQRYWRLRHVPGPPLAAISDLWLAYQYYTGAAYVDLIRGLHDRYGPVVRWGPNRVSFASPASVQQIYSTKNLFPKSEAYSPLALTVNGREMITAITIRDEKRMTQLKRHIAGSFTLSSFLKQESKIDDVLTQFLAVIKDAADDGSVVPLSKMLRWWSFDTLNQVAFSDDLGHMAAGADIESVLSAGAARFAYWRRWWALPRLERILFQNPITQLFGKSSSVLAGIAQKRVRDRHDMDEKALDQDLLGQYLAASRKAPEAITPIDVVSLTVSTINAGTEATSTSTGLILASLLMSPKSLQRLEAELLAENLPVPAPFERLRNLPYLDAAVREALRLWSILPHALEKEVTAGGATIGGVWVPAGTGVSASAENSQRSPEIWGSDANVYRPERWIEADEAALRDMDNHDLTFSLGRRACVGQHLARIEMKKLVASLLTAYKASLAEQPKMTFQTGTRHVELNVRLQRR